MPSPYNITNIPAPRVEFIDPRTGLMAREWYRFFFNLFNLTGAGTTDTSLADLQVGPPAINDLLGELGITYDQSQLASMMAQYEQATRSLQNQLDTAPAQPQLGTLAAVNADNVRLLGFSTNPSPPVPVPAPTGTLYWDGNSTLGLQMDQGVLAKIGQSQFTYVKASAAITKGQLCKHTGSVGSSGVITVAPTSIGMTDANEIVGVAAENIALNGFGFIQDSGDLRGFNTTGTSVGEVWADGDPLYYNPAYVGGLTNVKPSAPNLKSYVGEVINAGSSGSGSIHVRMSPGSVLGGTDSNVQFGTLADKDLIQYDGTLQYWKNVAASSISIGTATNLAGGAAGSVPYQSGAGATTFLSIGTAGQYARVNAGATAPEWASPAALTKTDDTNVTLTLGGNPTTALLNAASITVGWTGTLAVSRGGTGASTATANYVFAGPTSGGAAAPSFRALVAGDIPALSYVSSVGATAPITSTGGLTPTIGVTSAALTKVDDTNVTLTLGGSPTTALLAATSLTLGWTGQLSLARGGTNANLTASAGSVAYSTATALALNTAGNSGDWLKSAGTSAPIWTAPAALTKTDDTNVTLTLGGSASTALLNAASITVGWTGTLAVTRGGTGTGTAFTAGSVVFAGASGVYSQNNAQFFWDNTNNYLGIGTATPAQKLHVLGNTRQDALYTGTFGSTDTGPTTVVDLTTIIPTYGGARIRCYGRENSNVNVSYLEGIVVRTSTGFTYTQIASVAAGSGTGTMTLSISGNNLQVSRSSAGGTGRYGVSLNIFAL